MRTTLAFVAAVAVAAIGSVSVSASAESATPDGVAVSASAQFATLNGVAAVPMASGQMDAVAGKSIHFVNPSGRHETGEPPPGHKFHHTGRFGTDDCGGGTCPNAAPSYNGLCVAAGAGGLSGVRPCP